MATVNCNPTTEAVAIPDYDGYMIEPDGTVLSKKTGQWKKLTFNNIGRYPLVVLSSRGKAKTFSVHGLVLLCFVGPRPEGMCAAHNDGNPQNCHVSNLRWDTQKNNIADKEMHGTKLKGTQLSWTKLTDQSVREIRSLIGKDTLRSIAAKFGVNRRTVALIRDRKTWSWLD